MPSILSFVYFFQNLRPQIILIIALIIKLGLIIFVLMEIKLEMDLQLGKLLPCV